MTKVSRKQIIIYSVLLFCAVAAVFFPSLDPLPCPVSDDRVYIGEWSRLDLNVENIIFYFKNPVLYLRSPLVMFSFMIDRLIWGKHLVFGASVVNACIHALSAVMFFILLQSLHFYRRGKVSLRIPDWLAALTSFVWAVHPQRAESVAWICERKDCLITFLFLAASLCFIGALRRKKYDIAGTVLLALSFLCKPMLITFPALAAVFIFCETQGRGFFKKLKYIIPSAAISLLYLVVNLCWLGQETGDIRLLKPEWYPDIAANVARYFTKTFYPHDLCSLYPAELPVSDIWYLLIPLLLLLLPSGRSQRFRIYLLLPCMVMFAAAVSPVSGVVAIGVSEFADRYSYLPSLFLLTGAAFILALTAERFDRAKIWIIAILSAVSLYFIAEVRVNCGVYRDENKFVDSALAVENPHYSVLYSYGHRMLVERKYDQAAILAETMPTPERASVRVRREIAVFRTALGAMSKIYTGKVNEGLAEFDRVVFSEDCALLKDFSYNFARDSLSIAAKLHLQQGNIKKSAHMFGVLSDIYGAYNPAERDFYLGIRAMIMRDYRSAELFFSRAAEINPDERILANLKEARRRLK